MTITDDELEHLRRLTIISFPDDAGKFAAERALAGAAPRLIAELRSFRDLLATPMPCGWDSPRVAVMRGHGAEDMVTAEWLGEKPVWADEAIALGSALIRAAMEAKDGK